MCWGQRGRGWRRLLMFAVPDSRFMVRLRPPIIMSPVVKELLVERMLRYLLVFVPIAVIPLAAGRRVELAGRRDAADGLPDREHRLLLHPAG